MNSQEQKILRAFDPPGAREQSLADLGDPASVNAVVSGLVARGWLRPGQSEGKYARTEEGRLELAAPHDVTLYSRPGCHLCEEAKAQIAPLLQEFGARLTEINIDGDPGLRARYDYDVPVIFLGARKVAKHRVDAEQLRRQLRNTAGLNR
jgi:glutaredoxin